MGQKRLFQNMKFFIGAVLPRFFLSPNPPPVPLPISILNSTSYAYVLSTHTVRTHAYHSTYLLIHTLTQREDAHFVRLVLEMG